MPLDDTRYLKGGPVAARIIAEVCAAADSATAEGFRPKLVSITVGDVAAVDVYVRNQRAKAELAGIDFEERRFAAELTAGELEAAIHGMNADPRVTGIIIQRPVPPHIPIKAIQAAIHPLKDVEGMHPASIGNIVYNELDLAPCTAAASVELLKATGLDLKGLEVVMVGHSEIVGKPIAFLLMSEGATVTVCHHMTLSVSTSPTMRVEPSGSVSALMPISMTAAPGFTMSALISRGLPTATNSASARLACAATDRVM
jgi:methylenetetrahydrofolate dehydrogenase (NADP+)/methenyltetrahydrofolate cyclohydrolase